MRTILTIRQTSQGTSFIDVIEGLLPTPEDLAPPHLAVDAAGADLLVFHSDAEGGGRTGAVGDVLFQALTNHPHLAQQVQAALLQKAPIYLNDRSFMAQALPWETLRASKTFVGLEDDLRLARMVIAGSPKAQTDRTFDGELRVLAVLAAAGGDSADPSKPPLTALDEWKALFAANVQLPPGVSLRIHVIGCDPDVKAAVEAAAVATGAAPGDEPFTFAFLPPQDKAPVALIAAATELQPHIVHFFCHGFVGDAPHLELATQSDQIKGGAQGSVLLELSDLGQLKTAAPGVWAAVLNCCLGAAAAENSQPLARSLVAERGFPAVIGMQEPISRRDAHRFTESFYPSLLRRLGKALGTVRPRLDWPEVLVEPRQKLVKAHVKLLAKASDTKPWALPVLYVGHDDFELQIVAPPDPAVPTARAELTAAQAELSTLSALLVELTNAGALPAVLMGIQQRMTALLATIQPAKAQASSG